MNAVRLIAGVLLAIGAGLCLLAAAAEPYEFAVTREGRNFYRVDGRNLLIQTRLCAVMARSDRAALRVGGPAAGTAGELVFLASKDVCGANGIYGSAELAPGNYPLAINREGEDWYQVGATNTFIRTTGCITGAKNKQVSLLVSPGGGGRLVFHEGRSCVLEGLYSRLPP